MKTPMTANGNRLRFFRDVAGITMDTAASSGSTSTPSAAPTS